MCLCVPLAIAPRRMPLPDADLFHGECIRLDQGQTNLFIERLACSYEKKNRYIWTWFQSGSSPHFLGVRVGIHPERHVLKQVQRSVIRVWWLSPLPTHSRQISVATTLIRVGWATNLQKMKSWKTKCDKTFNGLIPKKLSLVQGVWRDPFKRSCFHFKVLVKFLEIWEKKVGGKKAFVWSRASLVPACHPNRKEIQEVGYFKMFFSAFGMWL